VDVRVERGERFASLRSSGSLAVRTRGAEAWLVGAAAHPIGGDRLRVGVGVGSGAELVVRSTSATLARASCPPRPSLLEVAVDVEGGGCLTWAPEPGVAGSGADHVTSTVVRLAPGARLCWSEVIVLGRHGENPGSWATRLRIEMDGQPVLASELGLGPGHAAWGSSAVLGGARCLWTLLVIDAGPAEVRTCGAVDRGGVVVPVGALGSQATTWGATPSACAWTMTALGARQLVEGFGAAVAHLPLGPVST